MKKLAIIYTVVFCLIPFTAFSKTPVAETPAEEVQTEQVEPAARPVGTDDGKKEAAKYFKVRGQSESGGSDNHYLSIHLGSFVSSTGYQWGGTAKVTDPGRLTVGLTYRLGSYGSFADSVIRADFISHELPEGRPVQVVILPMILFPEVGSKFPLYFGGGLGAGFFFNQINSESFLSANYQLVAGARFFDVLEGTGFFLEGGLKNNILLLSDGQFIGYFLSVGCLFTF